MPTLKNHRMESAVSACSKCRSLWHFPRDAFAVALDKLTHGADLYPLEPNDCLNLFNRIGLAHVTQPLAIDDQVKTFAALCGPRNAHWNFKGHFCHPCTCLLRENPKCPEVL